MTVLSGSVYDYVAMILPPLPGNYLEIGVNTPSQPGYNWVGVKAKIKHGVDPNVDTTYKMTSDEFFEKPLSQNYSIVFVDGLHIFEQAITYF